MVGRTLQAEESRGLVWCGKRTWAGTYFLLSHNSYRSPGLSLVGSSFWSLLSLWFWNSWNHVSIYCYPTSQIVKRSFSSKTCSVVRDSKWKNQVSDSQPRSLSTTLIVKEEPRSAKPLTFPSTELVTSKACQWRRRVSKQYWRKRRPLGRNKRCSNKKGEAIW